MKLIDQSIRNYHTVTVMVVLAAAVGIFCFTILPRQLTPSVDKPIIEVRTEYRGFLQTKWSVISPVDWKSNWNPWRGLKR